MVIGDVACYLDLIDEYGKRHQEMATFEICEHGELIGKKCHTQLSKRPMSWQHHVMVIWIVGEEIRFG